MIILLQYLIREIPEKERAIPGAIAGIIDCALFAHTLIYLHQVIL